MDLFLYDLKMMDEDRHRKWTGVSNARILSNLRKLSEGGHEIIIRIPILPGINDDEDNLRQTGRFLASLPKIPRVELLPYHNLSEGKYSGMGKEYTLTDIHPPTAEDMQGHIFLLSEYGLAVK